MVEDSYAWLLCGLTESKDDFEERFAVPMAGIGIGGGTSCWEVVAQVCTGLTVGENGCRGIDGLKQFGVECKSYPSG